MSKPEGSEGESVKECPRQGGRETRGIQGFAPVAAGGRFSEAIVADSAHANNAAERRKPLDFCGLDASAISIQSAGSGLVPISRERKMRSWLSCGNRRAQSLHRHRRRLQPSLPVRRGSAHCGTLLMSTTDRLRMPDHSPHGMVDSHAEAASPARSCGGKALQMQVAPPTTPSPARPPEPTPLSSSLGSRSDALHPTWARHRRPPYPSAPPDPKGNPPSKARAVTTVAVRWPQVAADRRLRRGAETGVERHARSQNGISSSRSPPPPPDGPEPPPSLPPP